MTRGANSSMASPEDGRLLGLVLTSPGIKVIDGPLEGDSTRGLQLLLRVEGGRERFQTRRKVSWTRSSAMPVSRRPAENESVLGNAP